MLYPSRPHSPALIYIGAFLPGACIGLGLLALLSIVKSGGRRAILAAVYGSVMCILAQTMGSPVIRTHAVLVAPG